MKLIFVLSWLNCLNTTKRLQKIKLRAHRASLGKISNSSTTIGVEPQTEYWLPAYQPMEQILTLAIKKKVKKARSNKQKFHTYLIVVGYLKLRVCQYRSKLHSEAWPSLECYSSNLLVPKLSTPGMPQVQKSSVCINDMEKLEEQFLMPLQLCIANWTDF